MIYFDESRGLTEYGGVIMRYVNINEPSREPRDISAAAF